MKFFRNRFVLVLLIMGVGLVACLQNDNAYSDPDNEDWKVYGGNKAGNRYSSLKQINRDNVKHLQPAWSFDTGENNNPDERGPEIQCQPIVIKGILYGTTPLMKLFAIDAATGKQRWKFDPFAETGKTPKSHALRGVAYWEDGTDKRILYGVGAALYAVNAETGEKIRSFGINGEVDFHEGLGDAETFGHEVKYLSVMMTTPGIIYKDLLITGSSVSESGDAPPGYIRAFNVRTGKLAWVFHTIPLPGEYGYESWPKDAYKKIGGANCWAGLVLDEKRGIVYAGTGSPSVDFYGGDRKGQNLFANCILALNAQTGKRVWHYQTIHHDLWDRDLPCQPNLVTVTHKGKKIDALAQATKDGLVFLLDRETGTPLFPVNEVPVPDSPALPGEHPWPTQPVPSLPAPFSLQELTEADITDRTPDAHAYVLNRFMNSRRGHKFHPTSLEGSLYLGLGGGAEWGGNATDPNGILYLNANNMLWFIQMRDKQQANAVTSTRGEALFNNNCFGCHGAMGKSGGARNTIQQFPDLTHVYKRLNKDQISTLLKTGRGRMPSFQHISKKDRGAIIDFLLKTDATPEKKRETSSDIHNATPDVAAQNAAFPYVPPYLNNGINQFRDHENYPAVKPPWGTLTAINLNTGNHVWQVPLGEYPELVEKGMANTGTENHGGPVVTAGGLIFIAATYDEKIRAFDSKTGEVVWEYKLPAGGFATPITYMVNGKQYVTIAAGGTRYNLKSGGSYVAFALPDVGN